MQSDTLEILSANARRFVGENEGDSPSGRFLRSASRRFINRRSILSGDESERDELHSQDDLRNERDAEKDR